MSNLQYNLILAEYAVNFVRDVMSKGMGPANRMESVVHRLHPAHLNREGPSTVPSAVTRGPSPEPGFLERLVGTQWERDRAREANAIESWRGEVEAKKQEIGVAVEAQRNRLLDHAKVLYGGPTGNFARERAAVMLGAEVQRSMLGNCGEQSCVAFKYLITRGASGLAIVDWGGCNHTFVVIGMDAGVPDKTTGTFLIPPNWGPDAVVCDPWYHEWFAVEKLIDWQTKMKRIFIDAQPGGVPAEKVDPQAAAAAGKQKDYAQVHLHKMTFNRLAYLPHGSLELLKIAGSSIPLMASAQRALS